MKVLFLHGWTSVVGGRKPTFLRENGHEILNPALPDDDSEELVSNSDLPPDALIEIGNDHRLADPEPLQAMLKACEALT